MIHEERGEAAVALSQRSRNPLEVGPKFQSWNPVKPDWLVIVKWFQRRSAPARSHERGEPCRDDALHECSQRGARGIVTG
jgi:hypothetical protein